MKLQENFEFPSSCFFFYDYVDIHLHFRLVVFVFVVKKHLTTPVLLLCFYGGARF